MKIAESFGLKSFTLILAFFAVVVARSYGQSSDLAIKALIDKGFENVSCTETEAERVYVLQNAAYRIESVGAVEAVDVIQKNGMPADKDCRIVVLNNNVPQYSLLYRKGEADPDGTQVDSVLARSGWEASYDLGESWSQARKTHKENRSLYKVDLVVYPQLQFRNLIIDKMYTFLFNISPAVQVSLWNGMKLTGQIIFPIINEYGLDYDQIRQGYVTLSQSVRFENLFLTATVGTFNNFRWGGGLSGKYVFKDPRFQLDGEIAYSGVSKFKNFRWKVSPLKRLTFSVGGSFYWQKFNTTISAHVEQYLLGEKGVKGQIVRHFKYASIGFYAMKVQHAGNHGYNGGFSFQAALPPYKVKRHGYIPRVMMSRYAGLNYNAGNERYYGRGFKMDLDSNIANDNSFNPIYIKSELLNH